MRFEKYVRVDGECEYHGGNDNEALTISADDVDSSLMIRICRLFQAKRRYRENGL